MCSGSLYWLHTQTTKWQWKDPSTHTTRAKKSFLSFLMMLVNSYFNVLLTMINVQCLPDYAHTVFLAVPMTVPQSLNPQRSKDTPYTFDEVTVNFKEENQKQVFWNTSTCIESNETECLNVYYMGGGSPYIEHSTTLTAKTNHTLN